MYLSLAPYRRKYTKIACKKCVVDKIARVCQPGACTHSIAQFEPVVYIYFPKQKISAE